MSVKMKFNFKKQEAHPHHHHINLLLVITLLLLIVLFFMIKPALNGYNISKQLKDIGLSPSEFMKSIDTVKSKLLIAETNLETCKSVNNDLMLGTASEKNATFKCLQDKSLLELKFSLLKSDYDFNLSRVKAEYDQKRSEADSQLSQNNLLVNKTLEDYDDLAQNSADNICCKSRVDDKRIDSYIVSNNIIVCASGEKNKITCT